MLLRATLVKGRPQGKSSRQGHIDRQLHSIGGLTAERLLKAKHKKIKPAVVEERPPWQYWLATPYSWRPDEQHRLLVTLCSQKKLQWQKDGRHGHIGRRQHMLPDEQQLPKMFSTED
jgi:hypothetical protein